MYADIESLVLSGELFNGRSRSSSPARSESPDAGWHDDELNEHDSDTERNAQIERSLGSQQQSIGMGPGRTGVKGVIRDHDEASSLDRARRAKEVDELNKWMEKASLGGKTFLEEEREKEWERAKLEGVREDLEGERRNVFGHRKESRFGHLREVGVGGFVSSVEEEERGIWVVVHIYEPSLDRCDDLDDTLALLARIYPDTKFLRARASALGFATAPRKKSRLVDDDDEDDPYADEEEEEDQVDMDMLPTMLVYRDGELAHNWVRVDWEAGRAGVEELLNKHHILAGGFSGDGNCGLPSDEDEDEEIWFNNERFAH